MELMANMVKIIWRSNFNGVPNKMLSFGAFLPVSLKTLWVSTCLCCWFILCWLASLSASFGGCAICFGLHLPFSMRVIFPNSTITFYAFRRLFSTRTNSYLFRLNWCLVGFYVGFLISKATRFILQSFVATTTFDWGGFSKLLIFAKRTFLSCSRRRTLEHPH